MIFILCLYPSLLMSKCFQEPMWTHTHRVGVILTCLLYDRWKDVTASHGRTFTVNCLACLMQPKATYQTSFSSSLPSPPSLSIMMQPPSFLPALMHSYKYLCSEHRRPLLCYTNPCFGAFSTIVLKPFCLFCLIFTENVQRNIVPLWTVHGKCACL